MDAAATLRAKETMVYERDRKGPPRGFPKLPKIPGARYVQPEFLALEKAHMWKRAWLYAGHADQLPKPGTWFLTRNTGSPILIVRDLKGEIRAYYNTCQHRGAPLVHEECGEARGFVCPYHGWAYTLDGRLTAIRDKRDFTEFDFAEQTLVSVRCESLGNLIFVNEDPEAKDLKSSLGPMADELDQYQLGKLRFVDSRSYEVNSNVKVLLDAFLEVYHLKSVHESTVDRFLDHRGMFITLWPDGHSRMITPNRRPEWRDPGTANMPRIETVTEVPANNNVSYHIFPNFVMPASDTGVPLLQFWPTSDRTCRVVSTWIAPDYDPTVENPLWETRKRNWERILYEDLQFAPQIQESLESPSLNRHQPLSAV